MHKLPDATVKLITSSQVITSIFAAVKELIENSIDAQASNIEIRLSNFGLAKIEVVDNGKGIPNGEEEFVAKPHYTSKIRCQKDLMTLSTLGFRGEALHSLCNVGNLSFSTKTEGQPVGMMFMVDKNGNIIDRKPFTRQNGVTMTINDLFRGLPVRKQFYSCNKKQKEELRKIQDLLIGYGLIHPELRLILKHNRSLIWQKVKSHSLKDSFISIFGPSCYAFMQEGYFVGNNLNVKITYILPSINATDEVCRKSNDRIFMFVNKRIVILKSFFQTIKSVCNEYVHVLQNKYPIAFLAIELPASNIDVNIEPDKTLVLFENMEEIRELIHQKICCLYKEQAQNCQCLEDNVSNSTKTTNSDDEHIEHNTTNIISRGFIDNPILDANFCTRTYNDSSDCPVELNSETFNPSTPEKLYETEKTLCTLLADPSLEDEESVVSHCIQDSKSLTIHSFDTFVNGKEITAISDVNNRTCLSKIEDNVFKEKSPFNGIEPQNSNFLDMASSDTPSKLFSQQPDVDVVLDYDVDNQTIDSDISEEHCLLIEAEEAATKIRKNKIVKSDNIVNEDYILRSVSLHERKPYVNKHKHDLSSSFVNGNGQAKEYTSAVQSTIDNWSRGTILNDKGYGKPIEPLRILQSIPSKAGKCAEKRIHVAKSSKISMKSSSFPTAMFPRCHKETYINFCIDDIKSHFNDQATENCDLVVNLNSRSRFMVIGEIHPWKIWIAKKEIEFYILNPFRAYERNIFEEMMKKHFLEARPLERSITITQSLMEINGGNGRRNWEYLQNASYERTASSIGRYLMDNRITSNGFEIRQRRDVGSSDTVCEIIKLTNVIDNYGLLDLNQIIDKIIESRNEENSTSLEKYRPGRVTKFLKEEAVRLASSTSGAFTIGEMNDIINKMVSISNCLDDIRCLHDKPVFYRLNTIFR